MLLVGRRRQSHEHNKLSNSQKLHAISITNLFYVIKHNICIHYICGIKIEHLYFYTVHAV